MEKSLRKLSQFDLEKLSASLDRDLVGVDSLLNHVGTIDFRQIGTNVNALVTELRGLSASLQSVVRDVNGTVKRMGLEKVSQNADTLILQLQATVQQLDVVLANLDTGSLNETLASVRRASVELEEALRELKQYPSGFLFGAPPPPAKAVVPSQ
jgi:hypothetical protein